MSIKTRKVAIVGAGLVGSSAGFSLVTQGVCEEIIMIDINHEKALGEAMDLIHCIEYLDQHTKVKAGRYEDCGDVDAIIITAGAPPKTGQSRADTLETSARIMESIIKPIMKSGFNGHFIIVSNPVDTMAYYVWKLSGLPKSQVIGTGTSVDSARLKHFIADLVQIDPRSVQAYSMGEHGDSQMVPWSHVYVGGKPFIKVISDNKDRVGNVDLDKLTLDTAQAGWEVFNRKGTTYYGIATAAVGIIKAIFNDENRIIPVSTLLDGEYGASDVFAGVPAVLNKDGVKELVEIEMTPEEREKFNKSIEAIKVQSSKLNIDS